MSGIGSMSEQDLAELGKRLDEYNRRARGAAVLPWLELPNVFK